MSLTPEELRRRADSNTWSIRPTVSYEEAKEFADELERLQKQVIEVSAHNEHVRIERVKADDLASTYKEALEAAEKAVAAIELGARPYDYIYSETMVLQLERIHVLAEAALTQVRKVLEK